VGPAHGAARLARIGVTGEGAADVCSPPPVSHTVEPDPALRDLYRQQIARFRALFRATRHMSLE
jgi:xylulokinase